MPSKASRKGYGGEVEVVKILEELGFATSRAFGSDGRALGEKSDIDVKATKGDITLLIQVKRRKKIADYLSFKNADVVMIRQDFKPWLWIVKNSLMEQILNGVKNVKHSISPTRGGNSHDSV
tara:strand:- start:2202 stop:2567 length:366 start_codon:yes stop_codon:yes gene_type:complete